MTEIVLTVNGSACHVEADPTTPLLYVLRNQLGLTGAKLGCGLEQCGACAVLVDGVSTLACARPVAEFADTAIVTVEGLAADDVGRRVQRAFEDAGAAQCGYCTPGMIVALTAALKAGPAPDEADLRSALRDHLCRCGAHMSVLRALRQLLGEERADA